MHADGRHWTWLWRRSSCCIYASYDTPCQSARRTDDAHKQTKPERGREIHKQIQIQTERDISWATQMQMRPRNQLLKCKCSWPSVNYCWGQFEIKFRKVFRSQNVGDFFLPLRSMLFSRIGMLMSRYRTILHIYNIYTHINWLRFVMKLPQCLCNDSWSHQVQKQKQ